MKSKLIYLSLIYLGIISCSEEEKVPNYRVLYANSNSLKVEGFIQNELNVGEWNYYYINGMPSKTLNYMDGLLVDSSTYYDSTGSLSFITNWKIIQIKDFSFKFSIPNEFSVKLLSDTMICISSNVDDQITIIFNEVHSGDNIKKYLQESIEGLRETFDSVKSDGRLVELKGKHLFGYNQYQIYEKTEKYFGTNIIGLIDDRFIDISYEYKQYHPKMELLFFDLIENFYFNGEKFMNPNDEFVHETHL